MSWKYSPLYSLPCRKPCDRYVNVDDVYEGAVPIKVESYGYEPTVESFEGAYEPTVSREAYGYEPTVESFTKNKNNGKQMNIQTNIHKRQNQASMAQGCSCECKPQYVIVREPYQDVAESDNCGCGPMHRAYRMEQCGYNASPTWNLHYSNPRMQPVQSMQPEEVKENMQQGMENSGSSCGCDMSRLVYKTPECGDYNQSQTWNDQRSFRENIQNKN